MRILRLCPTTWSIFDEENRTIEVDEAKRLWEGEEAISDDKYFRFLVHVRFDMEKTKDRFRGWA
jgi:hypothetical protein